MSFGITILYRLELQGFCLSTLITSKAECVALTKHVCAAADPEYFEARPDVAAGTFNLVDSQNRAAATPQPAAAAGPAAVAPAMAAGEPVATSGVTVASEGQPRIPRDDSSQYYRSDQSFFCSLLDILTHIL